jgi:hypothetical protein
MGEATLSKIMTPARMRMKDSVFIREGWEVYLITI